MAIKLTRQLNGYDVHGMPLSLLRSADGEGWHLRATPLLTGYDVQWRDWVAENLNPGAWFFSRLRDAREYLQALIDISPPPRYLEPIRLSRRGRGSYLARWAEGQEMMIERDTSGTWQIYDDYGHLSSARSLRSAQLFCAHWANQMLMIVRFCPSA